MNIAEKLTAIAENQEKVYEAGVKAWWDKYLQSGERGAFSCAFAGSGWTDETFKPTYNLIVTASAQNMFNGTAITDVAAALEKMGVELDTSEATSVNYMFGHSSVTHVPKISIKACDSITQLFYNANKLHTIEGLEFSDTKVQKFTNMFNSCKSLVNISEVKGIIQCDINFGDCPLSRASIDNIFKCFQKPGLELVETTATSWTANADGTFPYDSIVVKLEEPLPNNVTDWAVNIDAYFEFTGNTLTFTGSKFNASGEATIPLTYPRYKNLRVLDASKNAVDPSLYKVYEWANSGASILTATFNKKAVDKAYETSVGANDGSTSDTWRNLLSAHPNCTVVLS